MRSLTFLAAALLAQQAFGARSSEWQELRSQIRNSLHVPERLPELREKTYGQFFPVRDVAADRVSYYTDYDLRVPAIVYHQAGATITKHPAIIVVNGSGRDKSSVYAFWTGILYARAGAVVLTYDPIGEYERNRERRSGTHQNEAVVPVEGVAGRMTGFMVTDVLQAFHYLSSRKDVDEKRIAVLGVSTGATITSLACALNPNIRACVLADEPDPFKSLGFLGENGASDVFALNAKRGPTLIWNGTADSEIFDKLRTDSVARVGHQKGIVEIGTTPGGGHSAYFLSRPVLLWLLEKLKLPNWTSKQVEAMPETQLKEWLVKNHLQAQSDSNLTVLGESIPVVSRDDLHALPDGLWGAEQQGFVYETWLDRAKAAVRTGAP